MYVYTHTYLVVLTLIRHYREESLYQGLVDETKYEQEVLSFCLVVLGWTLYFHN